MSTLFVRLPKLTGTTHQPDICDSLATDVNYFHETISVFRRMEGAREKCSGEVYNNILFERGWRVAANGVL